MTLTLSTIQPGRERDDKTQQAVSPACGYSALRRILVSARQPHWAIAAKSASGRVARPVSGTSPNNAQQTTRL